MRDTNMSVGWTARKTKPKVLLAKDEPMRTFLHYSDSRARDQITVFGQEKDGLFYNYSDRIFGKKWQDGCAMAEKEAPKASARYFEIALAYYHDARSVDLGHVVLGCNRSTGYSYLAFGYKLFRLCEEEKID